MTASQRADNLFAHTKRSDIPAKATAYARHIVHQSAACSEVFLTAYAHYAQIEEGLTCDDEMYAVTDAIRAEYARATA